MLCAVAAVPLACPFVPCALSADVALSDETAACLEQPQHCALYRTTLFIMSEFNAVTCLIHSWVICSVVTLVQFGHILCRPSRH